MLSAEWHKREISKLLAIINEGTGFIHRDYLREKIKQILKGLSIKIHPNLKEKTERIYFNSLKFGEESKPLKRINGIRSTQK